MDKMCGQHRGGQRPPRYLPPVHIEKLVRVLVSHALKLKHHGIPVAPFDRRQELVHELVVGVTSDTPKCGV